MPFSKVRRFSKVCRPLHGAYMDMRWAEVARSGKTGYDLPVPVVIILLTATFLALG